jgi:hypothetical protein
MLLFPRFQCSPAKAYPVFPEGIFAHLELFHPDEFPYREPRVFLAPADIGGFG